MLLSAEVSLISVQDPDRSLSVVKIQHKLILGKKKSSQTEILQCFLSISQAMRVYLLTRLLWWTDAPWPKNSQHFDQCINTTLKLSKLFTPLNTFILLSSWKECAECLNKGTDLYERLNWLLGSCIPGWCLSKQDSSTSVDCHLQVTPARTDISFFPAWKRWAICRECPASFQRCCSSKHNMSEG